MTNYLISETVIVWSLIETTPVYSHATTSSKDEGLQFSQRISDHGDHNLGYSFLFLEKLFNVSRFSGLFELVGAKKLFRIY